MSSDKTNDLVKDFIAKFGELELSRYLDAKISDDSAVLTLIGNAGFHTVPEEFLHGETYEVTSGNLDLSSEASIVAAYGGALSDLMEKLKEKSWKRVYLVPTGHTTLVLQIKLIVYHVLRISTTDLFYSKGKYFELDLDYRHLTTEGRS